MVGQSQQRLSKHDEATWSHVTLSDDVQPRHAPSYHSRINAAEAAIDSHLGAARAVLSSAMSDLCAEHDAATARARSETRQLQKELRVSRQREAELEDKLAQLGSLMSTLG